MKGVVQIWYCRGKYISADTVQKRLKCIFIAVKYVWSTNFFVWSLSVYVPTSDHLTTQTHVQHSVQSLISLMNLPLCCLQKIITFLQNDVYLPRLFFENMYKINYTYRNDYRLNTAYLNKYIIILCREFLIKRYYFYPCIKCLCDIRFFLCQTDKGRIKGLDTRKFISRMLEKYRTIKNNG